jgi:hypothetical protein
MSENEIILLVKVKVGIRANGSCRHMTAFNKSFKLVKPGMSAKMASARVGAIAIVRVSRTRFQRGHCKFRKPYHTYVGSRYQIKILNHNFTLPP